MVRAVAAPVALTGTLAAALLLALATATALAQKPFTIATDPNVGAPEVAVDGAGDAHVLWSSDVDDGQGRGQIRYCTVRRAASACDPATVKTLHAASGGNRAEFAEAVFASGSFVVAVANAYVEPNESRIHAWVSADGGATFGEPVALAPPGTFLGALRDVALGPGAAVSMVFTYTPAPQPPDFEEQPPRVYYLHAPLAGPTPSAAAHLTPKSTFVADTGREEIAVLDGIPVIVRGDVDDAINPTTPRMEYQRYDGAGDLNHADNWTAAEPLSPTSQIPELAGGPRGVALVYPPQEVRSGVFETDPYQARVLDPTTFEFGAPAQLATSPAGTKPHLYAQPESGTFHFIQQTNAGIVWSSSDNGRDWSAPVVAADGEDDSCCGIAPRVAADPGGAPIVVWAEAAAVPTRIMGARPAPAANVPADRPTRSAGNRRFTATVAVRDCAAKRVVGSVAVRRRRARGRTSVRRVVFRLDGARRRPDRRAPYRRRYSLADAPAGSRHTLGAVVYVTVRKAGQRPARKRLRLTKSFVLCPA